MRLKDIKIYPKIIPQEGKVFTLLSNVFRRLYK